MALVSLPAKTRTLVRGSFSVGLKNGEREV